MNYTSSRQAMIHPAIVIKDLLRIIAAYGLYNEVRDDREEVRQSLKGHFSKEALSRPFATQARLEQDTISVCVENNL